MTITNPNLPLVVGIDGSEHGLHALDWAAANAAMRHWPVHLVNVFEPSMPIASPSSPLMSDLEAPEDSSAQCLIDAREHLAQHWPSVEVTDVSREGRIVQVLIDELDRGRMLVLGRRGIGRFAALVAGSTTLACAARAHGPVVVVPPSFATESTQGRVVVGVDGSDRGEAAIAMAFAEASARGGILDVVHAWEPPSAFSYDYAAYGGGPAWKVEQELAVAEVTAGWHETYPDVDVRTLVDEDHAAASLVRHGVGADLIVVGGRGHSTLGGMVIGSITNAVIQHAPCPVAVVHEPNHSRTG
jgi:nucleotide-binding universal stress UspA family protein